MDWHVPSVLVVLRRVLADQMEQGALPKRDHVVEQLEPKLAVG